MPGLSGRWNFNLDFNRDGFVTISEVGQGIAWLFFVPGDGLFYWLMTASPKLARFFEITPESYGGLASGILSFAAWVILWMLLAVPIGKVYRLIQRKAGGAE